MTLTSPTDELRMTRAEYEHAIDQIINEEVNKVTELVITRLTEDITNKTFINDGRKQWEVLPNRGVEPCLECGNRDNVIALIKILRQQYPKGE